MRANASDVKYKKPDVDLTSTCFFTARWASYTLEKLLELIKGYKEEQSQILLSDIMDMEAWGRFSVFETLASTKHYSDSHNWRIYFDSWRGKFLPLVWDPVGWMWQDKLFTIVRSKLHKMMFRNGGCLLSLRLLVYV